MDVGIDLLLIDKKLHVNNDLKKKFDVLKAYEKQFMELAKKINMDKAIAERIFKMIVDSGLYSFNESHKISCGII